MLYVKKPLNASEDYAGTKDSANSLVRKINAIKKTVQELDEADIDFREANLTEDELMELYEIGSSMYLVGKAIKRAVDRITY